LLEANLLWFHHPRVYDVFDSVDSDRCLGYVSRHYALSTVL